MTSTTEEIDTHISQKYSIKKRLGKGAYGIVWKAIDARTNHTVALKKIFDAFRNKTDAQRTFREVMFLMEFASHPNIITLRNILKANNDRDIYLVFDFMDTDLHNVIKKGSILKSIHKQYIMYQLFKAVMYLHSGNVLHRDLKPSNVLLDVNCTVKLADFGLSRSLAQLEHDYDDSPSLPELTEYVATRWYRAPEILLSAKRYTKGVDMWSLACILAEMWLNKALFPGTSTMNQIERIMQVVEAPSGEDIDAVGSLYTHSVLTNMPRNQQSTIQKILAEAPPAAVDLVSAILIFNPTKRLTVLEALSHPYVSQFRNPQEEQVLDYDVALCLNDDVQLSVSAYRSKLYEMLIHKKPQVRRIYHTEVREMKASRSKSANAISANGSITSQDVQTTERSLSTNTIKGSSRLSQETLSENRPSADGNDDQQLPKEAVSGAPLAGSEASDIDPNTSRSRLQPSGRSESEGNISQRKALTEDLPNPQQNGHRPSCSPSVGSDVPQSQSAAALNVANGRAYRAFENFSKTIGYNFKGSSYEKLAAYFSGTDKTSNKEQTPEAGGHDPTKSRNPRIWTVGVTRKIFRSASRDRGRLRKPIGAPAKGAEPSYIHFGGIDSIPNIVNYSNGKIRGHQSKTTLSPGQSLSSDPSSSSANNSTQTGGSATIFA